MRERRRIALYMRLSKEDGSGAEESNSIRMQRMLLHNYAKAVFAGDEILEFVDDGYSGTTMERPGVRRMLALAETSVLDCILVKDFSRFSRDYVELGSYLEQFFPLLGIRFISVNDHYDSLEAETASAALETAFRGLLCDLYSRDLSAKVRAALSARKENGLYASGHVPFGYEKKPEAMGGMDVSEPQASVVRRIFGLAAEGKTSVQIAGQLNAERQKTPMQYLAERGGTAKKPKGDMYSWSAATVCRILQNRCYVGDMVYGKYIKDHVGGKRRMRPRTEWKVHPNHHTPLVDRRIFDKAQPQKRPCTVPQRERQHPLVGRMVCGGCGHNLVFRKRGCGYFTCSQRYTARMCMDCVEKAELPFLERFVFGQIGQKLQEEGRADVGEQKRRLCAGKIREAEQAVQSLRIRMANLRREKRRAYEAYTVNRREELWARALQDCKGRMEETERKLSVWESEKKALEDQYRDALEVKGETAVVPDSLDWEIAERLIGKIVVYRERTEMVWNMEELYKTVRKSIS